MVGHSSLLWFVSATGLVAAITFFSGALVTVRMHETQVCGALKRSIRMERGDQRWPKKGCEFTSPKGAPAQA